MITRELLRGSRLQQVSTPSLVIDLEAVDHNIAAADQLLQDTPVALRPHFKAHKCLPLLKRQLGNRGWIGVTCQTAVEALTLARNGLRDIVVSNQIVDSLAVEHLVEAASSSKLTVTIDSPRHIDILERALARSSATLDVLIEIDVGMGRCGLAPADSQLLTLAEGIRDADRLHLAGLQAYEGHAVGVINRAERARLTAQAAEIARRERDRLNAAGHRCNLVAGGGTGTLDFAAGNGVLNEVQAGSYVLMDSSYAQLELPFRNALFCVATVISSRDQHTLVVDAGLKQVSPDSGYPTPTDDNLTVLGMSDEHTRLRAKKHHGYEIGDRVALIPGHIDPTMNLHGAAVVMSPDGIDEWPISCRTSASIPSFS